MVEAEQEFITIREHSKILGSAADFLEGLVEELYGDLPFDEDRFDDCMVELCDILNVELPTYLERSQGKTKNIS